MVKPTDKKFWTMQTKILAIAGTITAVTTALTALGLGGRRVEAAYVHSVERIACRVADSAVSRADRARTPIDSAIIAKLDGIRMDLRKSAYIQELSAGSEKWRSLQRQWRRDSLRAVSLLNRGRW